MNILDEIVSKKRKRVDEVKSQVSIEDIQNQLAKTPSSKSNFKKSLEKAGTKTEISKLIGKKIAEKAKSNKIESVVLDRNGYPYHGRVKAFADSARKNGLNL